MLAFRDTRSVMRSVDVCSGLAASGRLKGSVKSACTVALAALSLVAFAATPANAQQAPLDSKQFDQLARSLRENEDFKVRLQAAVILGRAGGEKAVPALVAALGDAHYTVRGAAALALANVGSAEAIEAVAARLDDEEQFVRDEALKALTELAWKVGPGAVSYLLAVRDKLSARQRLNVTRLLASIPDAAARRALAESSADEDEQVRAEADKALREAPKERAAEALRGVLGSPRYKVRQRACELLGELQDEESVARLSEILMDEVEVPEVKAAARAALARMKDKLDGPVLAQLLRHAPDRRERAKSATLLAVKGGERSYVALVAALEDPDVFVRGTAAMALSEMGDARAVGPLARLLNKEENVRILKIVERAIDVLQRGSAGGTSAAVAAP
jgi:HEAT repeat protein